MKKYIKSFFVVLKKGNNLSNIYTNQKAYLKWIEANNEEIKYKKFEYNPNYSIIIPAYNAPRELLKECLESVLNQSYDNFFKVVAPQ